MTTTPQQQPEDWTTLKVTRTYSEGDPSRIKFLQGAEPFLVVENPTPQQLHFSRRVAATWSACAGLSDPAAALQAAREALEWTLEQAEAWLGNYTGGPGEDEYRERLQQARAALQQLNGEAQP